MGDGRPWLAPRRPLGAAQVVEDVQVVTVGPVVAIGGPGVVDHFRLRAVRQVPILAHDLSRFGVGGHAAFEARDVVRFRGAIERPAQTAGAPIVVARVHVVNLRLSRRHRGRGSRL